MSEYSQDLTAVLMKMAQGQQCLFVAEDDDPMTQMWMVDTEAVHIDHDGHVIITLTKALKGELVDEEEI